MKIGFHVPVRAGVVRRIGFHMSECTCTCRSPPVCSGRSSTSISRRAILASLLSTSVLMTLGVVPVRGESKAEFTKLTDEQWHERLSDAAYKVLRLGGTERPFSSALNTECRSGVFHCGGCGAALFQSSAKYDSGTGWPSFNDAIPGAIAFVETPRDRLLLQKECRCSRCRGHIGHVFRDGPKPTGLRYCMNGVALSFIPDKSSAKASSTSDGQCAAV